MAAKKRASKPGPAPRSKAQGRTADDLESFLEDLAEVKSVVEGVAEEMRHVGMERMYVPSESQFNVHLPKMWDWAMKLQYEFKKELRAFRQAQQKANERDGDPPS